MRSFEAVCGESTCLKRVTVCELYEGDTLVSRESNRCTPPNGKCSRPNKVDSRSEYPTESGCNWFHAEIRALESLQRGVNPDRAVIYGHNFPCPDCEKTLRINGVKEIVVCPIRASELMSHPEVLCAEVRHADEDSQGAAKND